MTSTQRRLIPIFLALALTACAGGPQPDPNSGNWQGVARFAPYGWVDGSTSTAENPGDAERSKEQAR
jgi:hypothetical protein